MNFVLSTSELDCTFFCSDFKHSSSTTVDLSAVQQVHHKREVFARRCANNPLVGRGLEFRRVSEAARAEMRCYVMSLPVCALTHIFSSMELSRGGTREGGACSTPVPPAPGCTHSPPTPSG